MTGMIVAGRLELIALDATDIAGLASFYGEMTGSQTVRSVDGWITLRAGDGQEVAFQQVAEHISPQWPGQERPQQVHLDLLVDGHEGAAQRAVALGATRLADGATWITMADPAGHPFDLSIP
jgi:extradiol dioxygenase family protein